MAVVPGNADEPRDGRKDYAEDRLQRSREPRYAVRGEKIVNASENAIQQRNQREKRNQHRGDVQRKVKAIGRSFGGGIEYVAFFAIEFYVWKLVSAGGQRVFSFGYKHLGDEDRAGRSHDHRCEQMPRLNTERYVGSHDCTGDVSHSRRHDDHQLRYRHRRQVWTDGKGRLGLTHEDTGGNVHGLDAAGAHETHHDLRQLADDELHHAVVIKDGEEGRDENDDGKNLKREEETVLRGFASQRPKNKLRPDERIREKLCDRIAGNGNGALSPADTQEQQGEDELQCQADGDRLSANCPTVGREEIGKHKDCQNTEHAGQTSHEVS